MRYVYIAGPYTGEEELNTVKALAAAEYVIERGDCPFVPHLSHWWHKVYEHSYEFWMELDRQWLARCDILVRLPGLSSGADREVAWMHEHRKPVYTWDEYREVMEMACSKKRKGGRGR